MHNQNIIMLHHHIILLYHIQFFKRCKQKSSNVTAAVAPVVFRAHPVLPMWYGVHIAGTADPQNPKLAVVETQPF